MLRLVCHNYIRKENVEKALELTRELVRLTRQEEGCISYEYYRDTQKEGHFIMLEQWESQSALDKHMQSEHFKRIVPQKAELAEKPSDLYILEQEI